MDVVRLKVVAKPIPTGAVATRRRYVSASAASRDASACALAMVRSNRASVPASALDSNAMSSSSSAAMVRGWTSSARPRRRNPLARRRSNGRKTGSRAAMAACEAASMASELGGSVVRAPTAPRPPLGPQRSPAVEGTRDPFATCPRAGHSRGCTKMRPLWLVVGAACALRAPHAAVAGRRAAPRQASASDAVPAAISLAAGCLGGSIGVGVASSPAPQSVPSRWQSPAS